MTNTKPKIATCWLDGCSGCHMSILDIDEKVIDLARLCQVVYGPLVDTKTFPEGVDVTLVEGAINSEHDLHQIREIRQRTKFLVCLGDCSVTGNIPSMRNSFTTESVLARGYTENGSGKSFPTKKVPALLTNARPVHDVVKVDLFIPGCPPSAQTIFFAVTELLAGRIPDLSAMTRFGA